MGGHIKSIVVSSLLIGLRSGVEFGKTSKVELFGVKNEIKTTKFPNQGILHSAINGIFLGMILGMIFVLCDGLLTHIKGLPIKPMTWLSIELLMGAFGALMIPSTQQHFTLRVILWWNGYIPWNYARFLNYATERMFLQRIGGRYRFIHKLLQEHFAQLQPTPEWGTISSKAIPDEDWDDPW